MPGFMLGTHVFAGRDKPGHDVAIAVLSSSRDKPGHAE
jgi:hypothetical protein